VTAFEIDKLRRERWQAGRRYLEFLRVPDLSLGLYVLPDGATDPQSAHTEDEAYYVVSGRARIRVGDEVRPVAPGSIVFVEAGVPHRFEEIVEELTVLVVFGPAERSRAAATGASATS
jgi:quercetin dioxygenase-like cupin family protein